METTEETTTENRETESSRPTACCCSRRVLICGGAFLAISLFTGYMTMPQWLGYVIGGDANSAAIGDETKIDLSHVSKTDETRLQIVGKWTMTTENSLRTMTLHEDGTGLLIYEPTSFFYKSVLGNRVEVDLAWVKSGDYVEFQSLRGRPAAAFELASSWEGKYKKRRLESVDDEKMVLINEANDKNSPKSIWYRLKE